MCVEVEWTMSAMSSEQKEIKTVHFQNSRKEGVSNKNRPADATHDFFGVVTSNSLHLDIDGTPWKLECRGIILL
jgi:hypothetical protein